MSKKILEKHILQKDIPDRNHLSNNKINYLYNSFFLDGIYHVFTSKSPIDKPEGLWYSLKWYWIENLSVGMRYYEIDYTKKDKKVYTLDNEEYLYKIELQKNVHTNINDSKGLNKILLLKKYKDCKKFYDKYKYEESSHPKRKWIEWKKVYMDYGGIELADIHLEKSQIKEWFFAWDVPSGCIWNKDLIKNFERVI